MIIRSDKELKQYKEAGKKSTKILRQLFDACKEGVTSAEIDALADKICRAEGVKPSFRGVGPKNNQYKWATCISVNDTVVHGIPDDRPFKKGDLVKVDFGIIDKSGLFTDHCFTKSIGEPNEEDLELMKVTRKAIQAAAKKAIVGNKIGDLSYTMQSIVEAAGFSVAKEFVGHGIGRGLHDEPQIPAWGIPHTGRSLEDGMVLCVEAQVMASENDDLYIDSDGWTVKSEDGAKAAMFEYMVVVKKGKPVFLTPTMDWPLF